MRNLGSFAASVAVVVGVVAACGRPTEGTCDERSSCAGDLEGGAGADSVVDVGADGTVSPPAGCDALAEPKDAPKCVVSEFGIFVDGVSGSDIFNSTL